MSLRRDYDLPGFIPVNIRIDEVYKFWVVTYPTPDSELIDILFQTTIPGIMLQTKGGLQIEEIAGIFKTKEPAEKMARHLLRRY